jgi:hypothetical protein
MPWLRTLRSQSARLYWFSPGPSQAGSPDAWVSLADNKAEVLLERVPAGLCESRSPAAADSGDPAGAEGVAAQGGAGGA